MKIGIIGLGMVGDTTFHQLRGRHDVKKYDPGKNLFDDMADCKAVFICVPVNTMGEKGQNLSILRESLQRCEKETFVFIRSTILPGTCEKLSKEFPELKIIHVPEFFTERTRLKDASTLDISCGGLEFDIETTKDILNILFESFPGKKINMVTNNEAELAKYAHNCFGSIKVWYWNMIYKLCEKEGIDYESVKEVALMSGYINKTHTQVPGPDGHLGFSGMCFPKDILAFYSFLKEKSDQIEEDIAVKNIILSNLSSRDDVNQLQDFPGVE